MELKSIPFEKIEETIRQVVSTFSINHVDSEDIIQDVNQKLCEKFSTNYEEQGNGLAWIRALTRHYCIDLIRKHSKYKEIPLDDIDNMSQPLVDDDPKEKLYLEKCGECLDCLKESNPDCVTTRVLQENFVEYMSLRKISEIENVPVKRVRKIVIKWKEETRNKLLDIDDDLI